jgi:2-phosphosulfolactate phosphatase
VSVPIPGAHTQRAYAVRMEWGPVGASATVGSLAVVVDVLSFTTTLTVAVERGIEVFPFRWRDSRAAAHALAHGTTLAVGRFEALARGGANVSLSPASLWAAEGVQRVVLPSPNGSTIAFELADSGARVIGACLRNRRAVASYLLPRLQPGTTLTVVAAGERWPDESMRPAVEDLWGAGAVLAALVDAGAGGLSPEARVAEAAFRAVEPTLADDLRACAGGRELVEAGFAEDLVIAAELDCSEVVPVLHGDRFAAS